MMFAVRDWRLCTNGIRKIYFDDVVLKIAVGIPFFEEGYSKHKYFSYFIMLSVASSIHASLYECEVIRS